MPKPLLLTLLLAALSGCCPEQTLDERGWPKELVLGLVPALEAEALVENLAPLTDYLSTELGVPVRAFVPQDYTGLVEALGAGRADIGMLPPFATMLGMQRYDIEPILVSMRRGATGYRSQWLTHDASICAEPPQPDENGMLQCQGELTSMRGHNVAFIDPNSTSGFLFPVLQLRDAGIDHERDLRGLFVGRHDAAVLAVYSGDLRFAVSYDDARNMVRPQYPDVGEKVIAFAHTEMMPNDGVQLRAGLPADLRQAIRDAFVNLARSQAHLPEQEKLLWILYEIDDFTDATPDLYAPVAAAYQLLRQ